MSDIRYINRKVLEALKPMGRMDGDTQIGPGTGPAALAESSTTEAWRRECELLRGENAKLKAERQNWIDRCKANDATYDSLQREHRELQAEYEHLRAAGGFPGMVKEIEALHIIIKHMAPLL
jgi:hypothetical protein